MFSADIVVIVGLSKLVYLTQDLLRVGGKERGFIRKFLLPALRHRAGGSQ